MWPEIVSGKRYWARSLLRPRAGSHVVFRTPRGEEIFVKKVSRVVGDGYEVTSLVSWGSGSGDFGVVPQHNIIGTLIGRF